MQILSNLDKNVSCFNWIKNRKYVKLAVSNWEHPQRGVGWDVDTVVLRAGGSLLLTISGELWRQIYYIRKTHSFRISLTGRHTVKTFTEMR